MNTADIAEYVGYLFVAYSTGWISGFLILTWKRATDFI